MNERVAQNNKARNDLDEANMNLAKERREKNKETAKLQQEIDEAAQKIRQLQRIQIVRETLKSVDTSRHVHFDL